MKSATLAEIQSLTTPCLSLTELIISIYLHIFSLLLECCYVSSFPRTAKGLLLDTPLLRTRPSDSNKCAYSCRMFMPPMFWARKHIPLKSLTTLGPNAESLWGISGPLLSFHQNKGKSSFKF